MSKKQTEIKEVKPIWDNQCDPPNDYTILKFLGVIVFIVLLVVSFFNLPKSKKEDEPTKTPNQTQKVETGAKAESNKGTAQFSVGL